jgi:adenosine deaminase
MKVALWAVCGLLLLLISVPGQELRAQSAPAPAPASTSRRETQVASYMERIRREPPALRAFLRAMPKGADLHTHLSGAIYAESYIRWAAELPLCIELSTSSFVQALSGPPATCRNPAEQRPAAQVLQDPVLYRNVIDALSTRNLNLGRTTGHYQFFDAFVKFDAVPPLPSLVGRAIAEIMHRAALQNVMHVELMVSLDTPIDVSPTGLSWDTDEQFQSLRERLLSSIPLKQRIDERRRWLDTVGAEVRTTLGCGTLSARPGCDISLRFITYSLRGLAPEQVFARAMFAFELAATDPRVVGVNLVMPEDWYVPMRDYDLHMRMFRFFRNLHPTVNVALHAGELAFGLVPPESLGTHIRQAINVGGAQRIGHGTDVMYDPDPAGLMRDMARRRIPVEISLSSSDLILGVRGDRHPIRGYLRAGVPVVIATDDEGVARSDLTNEYQRAVEEQGLNYAQLKEISRNSIEYSFLPRDEKARVRRALETAFERFESGF